MIGETVTGAARWASAAANYVSLSTVTQIAGKRKPPAIVILPSDL
jgi:hypothetical protein